MQTKILVNYVTTYSVCTDCYMLEATGDATFLDYYYDSDKAKDCLDAIEIGYERIIDGNGHIVAGELLYDFDKKPCECCASQLHGQRYTLHHMT